MKGKGMSERNGVYKWENVDLGQEHMKKRCDFIKATKLCMICPADLVRIEKIRLFLIDYRGRVVEGRFRLIPKTTEEKVDRLRQAPPRGMVANSASLTQAADDGWLSSALNSHDLAGKTPTVEPT
ncbi:hypothetical protein NDU88_001868 [Pleurodeles waltl]|uniref:Uncharacterized protein n=1 Tax=Pleurodeles waltl TaxID=8319 RepID=A0AAV7P524_PLEWA|nr:hypothetical protein NDU88_001868 [Pleurodeles waltl]